MGLTRFVVDLPRVGFVTLRAILFIYTVFLELLGSLLGRGIILLLPFQVGLAAAVLFLQDLFVILPALLRRFLGSVHLLGLMSVLHVVATGVAIRIGSDRWLCVLGPVGVDVPLVRPGIVARPSEGWELKRWGGCVLSWWLGPGVGGGRNLCWLHRGRSLCWLHRGIAALERKRSCTRPVASGSRRCLGRLSRPPCSSRARLRRFLWLLGEGCLFLLLAQQGVAQSVAGRIHHLEQRSGLRVLVGMVLQRALLEGFPNLNCLRSHRYA